MEDPARVFVAPSEYAEILAEELLFRGTPPLWRRDRLFGMADAHADMPLPAWAQDTWLAPRFISVRSIAHAARELKAIQRNWVFLPLELHRRGQLISGQLPHVSAKPFRFGDPLPVSPLGVWTLWDKDLILASPERANPFAHGEVLFAEDRIGPPSRAYLKLWEALTLLDRRPGPGEVCVDLGSSPGGWTWVLARLGARVVSIDKAPLDPAVAHLPAVEYRKESAFAVDPASLGHVDWLCCDVVCYPARLLALIRRWLEAGNCRNFVCTVKFQGKTDHAVAAELAAIPGSRLLHLAHNKHELTWMLAA